MKLFDDKEEQTEVVGSYSAKKGKKSTNGLNSLRVISETSFDCIATNMYTLYKISSGGILYK